MLIRISIGSLFLLKNPDTPMASRPSTLYLLQFSKKGCLAHCAFCAQSHINKYCGERLGRITWPVIGLSELLEKKYIAKKSFSRICVQSLFKRGFEREILLVVKSLRSVGLPLSVAINPVSTPLLEELRRNGVDYLGVGLDVVSRKLFEKLKKPFRWARYVDFIERAVEVFGRGRVFVHVIVGLGEREEEVLRLFNTFAEIGVKVALFPLVSYDGSYRVLPPKNYYRRVQALAYLVNRKLDLEEYVVLKRGRIVFKKRLDERTLLESVLTQGCPGCNRPFYTEGPLNIYNYPSFEMALRDKDKVKGELQW